jgi:hypothetical protein
MEEKKRSSSHKRNRSGIISINQFTVYSQTALVVPLFVTMQIAFYSILRVAFLSPGRQPRSTKAQKLNATTTYHNKKSSLVKLQPNSE